MLQSRSMDEHPLSVFRELIRAESIEKSGRPIPSSTADQASIVLETFFSHGTQSVRIVTGRLNHKVYGTEDIIVEAKKFLVDPGRHLTIVFLEKTEPRFLKRHPLLSA